MLRIRKLKATNVHGYIPINLTFKPNLTFLTGSNGCGKTTALKLISSILQPNFELLNEIIFDSVNLVVWINDEEIQVSLKKDQDSHSPIMYWEIKRKYRSRSRSKEKIEPINGEFDLFPKRHFLDYSREELNSIKENVSLRFVQSIFYNTIHSFSSPILLGIDRKITGVNNFESEYQRRRRRHFGGSSDISFNDAQLVISDYVSSMAEKKKELVEEFKSNVFKSLFSYLEYTEKSPFQRLNRDSLIKKKEDTITAIKSLEMGDNITREVGDYFDNIRALQMKIFNVEDRKDADLNEWWINRPHLQRIESVAKNAEDYQKEIDILDKPLNEITRIVNYFFKEGNKKIRIGANGLINVEWSDKGISTRNLSSGEIQLIVIIIHLVFCEFNDEPTVFVIDEPELSLHISWQEKFVDAITSASPSTQFILATHSPSIISKLEYEKNCIYMENA